MMVVDTNVFVYALVGASEFRADSLNVLRAPIDVVVPGSFRAELANVLWQYIRRREATLEECSEIIADVDEIIDREVSVAGFWERALQMAVLADHPPYDAIFAALAEREGTRVVTYDRRFRLAFPDLTVSPAEFMAG